MEQILKEKIRKETVLKLKSVTKEEQREYSRKAASVFLENTDIRKAMKTGIYFPISWEADILVLSEDLRKLNHEILLPVISEKKAPAPMSFYSWQKEEELILNNRYKTFEPSTSSKESQIPDIIIAPLISFDMKGTRLGRGGGFYDITIKYFREQNKSLICAGYGFEIQKANNLPKMEHDQKLDIMVTENNFYKF